MDLSDGTYLGHDIEAVCGDWLVVYDGKYNHMLFNVVESGIIHEYKRNAMPSNNIGHHRTKKGTYSSKKEVEYYTKFDNAVKNLCKVVANNGFFSFRKVIIGHP